MEKENRYYVYLHKDLNNAIFYVGKGTGSRAWCKKGRSQNWHKVSADGIIVELHTENLTETEALTLERQLIESTPNLVNFHKWNTPSKIPLSELKKLIKYSPENPSGLSYIVDTNGKANSKRYKGDNAGTLTQKGYWSLEFKNKAYRTHRIVYELHFGTIPDGLVINHKNGDKSNNSIENLEAISQRENSRKTLITSGKKLLPANTSGLTRISKQVYNKYNNKYVVVTWRDINGKFKRKLFSLLKHSEEDAMKLAIEFNEKITKEVYGINRD